MWHWIKSIKFCDFFYPDASLGFTGNKKKPRYKKRGLQLGLVNMN